MKKDFVHPGEKKAAIYQWVVYEDGKIDVLGDYTKFGHNDENPDYPDGVAFKIYLNGEVLKEEDVPVLQGDGNDSKVDFMLIELEVKRGDILSFVIGAKGNISYDAGSFVKTFLLIQLLSHLSVDQKIDLNNRINPLSG